MMSSINLHISSNRVYGEQQLGWKSRQINEHFKFDLAPQTEGNSHVTRHEAEENVVRPESEENRTNVLSTPLHASISNPKNPPSNDSSLCSASLSPALLCRQFWKAGKYDDKLSSQPATSISGSSYLRIHPKFLHSNATAHKWVFGAIAELLDNSIDEIQNGATSVIVDKTLNPRDGTPALLVQDNGGGMDPDAMRRCISFGFSDKKSETTIGQYGNGFKTSSMRLGADAVVFSRHINDRKLTQSVGLLSYTFLMQTRQDRVVVPMIDYQFNPQTGKWNTLNNEQHFKNNISILLQWSPFTTEAELLKNCDDIGSHGTKIIIYNLWHRDEGKLELDFDSDPEDIIVSGHSNNTSKIGSRMSVFEHHLANRLRYSLRAYLSILYLRIPENFSIILRGRVVEYHNLASDLKYPEFILYRPHNVEGSVITSIGFLKEAPAVNIHGFNVYHKNRLILPFWPVVSSSWGRGRGVVGVLEANFMEPTHSKQDFEKTPVFQKLESRLKGMTHEYWDYHCGLIGYQYTTKKPRPTTTTHASAEQVHSIYQPVQLAAKESSTTAGALRDKTNASLNQMKATTGIPEPSFHQTGQGTVLKRKGRDHVEDPERAKRMGVIEGTDTGRGENVQHVIDKANCLEDEVAVQIIQENKRLHLHCQEYQKTQEELNLKVLRLNEMVHAAKLEYARLMLESESHEKIKKANYRVVT